MAPIRCSNPKCLHRYDTDLLKELISKRGLIHADCGNEFIYQGISCTKCNHTTLFKSYKNNPLFNLNGFILQPNPMGLPLAINEQILIQTNKITCTGSLEFDYFRAWDIDDFPEYIPDIYDGYRDFFPPLLASEEDIIARLNLENMYGNVCLRRLYQDTEIYRNLFTLLAPKKIDSFIEGFPSNAAYATSEIENRNSAIIYFFEKITEKSAKQILKERLLEVGAKELNNEDFLNYYNDKISIPLFNKIDLNVLIHSMQKIGWEDSILEYLDFSAAANFFLTEVLKVTSLHTDRKKLSKWTKKIEEGSALFVYAPMGIGKTTSIKNFLLKNDTISAVIFMPNKAMCREISNDLRREIALNKNLNDSYSFYKNTNRFNFTINEYLPDEIYFIEGITEDECVHYHEIINDYKKFWFKKGFYCADCEKNTDHDRCKFLEWTEHARRARIVLTTHKLYDIFNANKELHEWIQKDNDEPKRRDAFIIDEDLIINNCYAPIVLEKQSISHFCSTFYEFLEDNFKDHNEFTNIFKNISTLFGSLLIPETSTVIPPIDKNFEIDVTIKNEWNKSYSLLEDLVPDYIETIEKAHNLLPFIEHGIKNGVVVHKYKKGIERKIFFPNPKVYNLENLPPHIFFDGTKIDNKYLEKKLTGVKLTHFHLDLEISWGHKIYQNINTDITISKIENEKENVKKFLIDILEKHGKSSLFYIHTSKKIRNSYLDSFVQERKNDYNIIVDHYGNLRGKNSAKDSNIHIMLGSFMPPDALEIAMGLEFIQEALPGNRPCANMPNFWTFKGSVPVRTYKTEFAVIDELAKAYRHSEQRQALARSRYIFHPVTFYILAKEPIDLYEPYLPKPICYNYREEDLFRPRKQRIDNKYEEVKTFIIEALTTPIKGTNRYLESVSDNYIAKTYKLNRNTVRNHREQLEAEKFIERVSPRKYRLVDSSN